MLHMVPVAELESACLSTALFKNAGYTSSPTPV